ncbi:hypothetical protein J4E08_15450 [Sagittula sp. NFXS13]|uniref:hypothetical protein n=1 Tax=Sagittula sp. NFXS13 TaxID=2819095 RepID=UPI0032DEAA0C
MTEMMQIDPPQGILDDLVSLYDRDARDVVVEEVGKLLEAFPASYMLWKLFGAALMSEGFPMQAEMALRQALNLRPESEEAQSNHAIAQKLLDDLVKAEDADTTLANC